MIIKIMGMPKTGKTALARALSKNLDALYLDSEQIRKTINKDLALSRANRIEHSRRLGEMARFLNNNNINVIVDFVSAYEDVREAFGQVDLIVWMNKKNENFEIGENALWENPTIYDLEIKEGLAPEEEVELVINKLKEKV